MSKKISIKDSIALVSGANRGIGKAITEELLNKGLNKSQSVNLDNDLLVKVLTQWQDHDKQLVLDAYRKLNSRNFFVPGKNSILTDLLIDRSISSFCSAHRISNID